MPFFQRSSASDVVKPSFAGHDIINELKRKDKFCPSQENSFMSLQ